LRKFWYVAWQYILYTKTFGLCFSRRSSARNLKFYQARQRPIYTTQRLPKTVACNLLTTWFVLCKSNTQLAYVVVGELCARWTQYYLSCNQVACDSFGQKCAVGIGLKQLIFLIFGLYIFIVISNWFLIIGLRSRLMYSFGRTRRNFFFIWSYQEVNIEIKTKMSKSKLWSSC
jgi:hypothetical protein